MQNEPVEVSLLVIDALDALDVPYFIGGSLASSVHGIIRTTMDVDLIADLSMQHVDPLVRRVEGLSDLVRVYRAHAPAYRDLVARIAATDWLIDQIVYKLYGLTEEEIAIVEGRV